MSGAHLILESMTPFYWDLNNFLKKVLQILVSWNSLLKCSKVLEFVPFNFKECIFAFKTVIDLGHFEISRSFFKVY